MNYEASHVYFVCISNIWIYIKLSISDGYGNSLKKKNTTSLSLYGTLELTKRTYIVSLSWIAYL